MQPEAHARPPSGYARHDEPCQEWTCKGSNGGSHRKRYRPAKRQEASTISEAHIWQLDEPCASVGDDEEEDQRITGEQALASSIWSFGGGGHLEAPFLYADASSTETYTRKVLTGLSRT